MELPFSLRQKVKIAALLFAIMCCTLIIAVLEDKNIQKLDQEFSSIYQDRLVPAVDLSQMSAQLYEKRRVLESSPFSKNETLKKLAFLDQKIDSLLQKYEKTILVAIEQNELRNLKSELKEIKLAELAFIEDKTKSFKADRYNGVVQRITHLTAIQGQVGSELSKSSQQKLMIGKFYSSIQLALAVLIGILVVVILATTSNLLNVKPADFSAN